MRRGYIGETEKQIHYRICEPEDGPSQKPLICLPPAPHSGLYFSNVMEKLSGDRIVIAVDTPGYGGSDPLDCEASIENYAERVSEVCNAFSEVDIWGFIPGVWWLWNSQDISRMVLIKF